MLGAFSPAERDEFDRTGFSEVVDLALAIALVSRSDSGEHLDLHLVL